MKNLIYASLLIVVGVVAGTWISPAMMTAEVRKVAPQEAFESGGARSIAVLKEIVVALERVEKRLERIESAVRELKTAPAPNPARLP
jgi:hypothetical protein